jgi:hypothetical protein
MAEFQQDTERAEGMSCRGDEADWDGSGSTVGNAYSPLTPLEVLDRIFLVIEPHVLGTAE